MKNVNNVKVVWASNDKKSTLVNVELTCGCTLTGIVIKAGLGGGYFVNESSSIGKNGRYYKNYYLNDDLKSEIYSFLNK